MSKPSHPHQRFAFLIGLLGLALATPGSAQASNGTATVVKSMKSTSSRWHVATTVSVMHRPESIPHVDLDGVEKSLGVVKSAKSTCVQRQLPHDIAAVLEHNAERIFACVENTNKRARAALTFSWEISAEGNVTTFTLGAPRTPLAGNVGACIDRVFAQLAFPRNAHGHASRLDVNLRFDAPATTVAASTRRPKRDCSRVEPSGPFDETMFVFAGTNGVGTMRPAVPYPRRQIRETIAGARGEIQRCFARERNRRPESAGRVVLELTVASDGEVTNAQHTSNAMKATRRFLTCLESAAKAVRFSARNDGPPVRFRHGFTFRQPADDVRTR